MKNPVLPFTCLKKHFEGEIFAPVFVANQWQLESPLSVLVGTKGNAYAFKSLENASAWIDSNLIRAGKNTITKQTAIDKLVILNAQNPRPWIQTEIDILEQRAQGEWGVYLDDGIILDFGVIAQGLQGVQGVQGLQGIQGEKGDKGDTGLQGLQGEKGDTGAAGVNGSGGMTFGATLNLNYAANARGSVAHGLGVVPDGAIAYLEFLVAVAGYQVGDRICMHVHPIMNYGYDAVNVFAVVGSGGSFNVSNKLTSVSVGIGANQVKIVVKPYKINI